jgi:hypothetical protein
MGRVQAVPTRRPSRRFSRRRLVGLSLLLLCAAFAPAAQAAAIQCANLIYGGTHTSRCFSDEFLSAVQKETTISTERRFKTVKLASDELFKYPFTILTGEKDFRFTPEERKNLKRYLESGGFLLVSAGCSNKDFDRAFRREIKSVFEDKALERLPDNHTIYRTVYQVAGLKTQGHGPGAHEQIALEGLNHGAKTVLIYSKHGLNDTAHTEGCCCCGGSEITNALEVNVNIFTYALLY